MKLLKNIPLAALALALTVQAAQAQLARKRAIQDETLPSEMGTAFDNTVEKMDIKVRRVAIIPNRMPLFLTEADQWRKYNWQILAGMFEDRGFDIVDFDSSLEAFTRANLPMEDTGASEQKFARLAEILQADVLVMPFYGTAYQGQNVILMMKHSYIALVTLQIYSAKENKFVYRSDQTGKKSITTGWAMMGTIVGMIMPPVETVTEYSDGFGGTYPVTTETRPFQIAMPVIGLAMDLALALIPPKRHWEMAFLKADRAALQPFFAVFPGPMGSKTKKKKVVKKAAPKPAPEEGSEEEEAAPAKTAPAKRPPAKTAPPKEEPEEEDLGLGVDE